MTDQTDPTDPTDPTEPGSATRPEPDAVRLTENDDGVTIEVTVAAPVATVWPHLRDPELIRRWHGWDFGGLDAEVDFIYREHARAEAAAHVIQTKGGPAPGSYELGDRFDLQTTADGAGTIVRITRGPRGTDPDWDAMYDDITQGWVSFLAQLRFAVEQHPDDERRTVFCGSFAGPTSRALDLLGPTAVAGVAGQAGLGVGDQCRLAPAGPAELIDPIPTTATVWFRTDGQLGLTVHACGPGLLVVADKPGPTPGTADTSMIIVSTYGRSDAEFAAIETAWQSWWQAHFPAPEEAGSPR